MTAYVAARLDARPVSTGSRIRAATSKLAPVVQGRRRTSSAATLGRQRREPLNDTVALGCLSFKPCRQSSDELGTPHSIASSDRER